MRDAKELARSLPNPRIPKGMLDLASHIFDTRAGLFDPTEFTDVFESELKKLVMRKAAGKAITYEEPRSPPTSST